MHSVARSSDDFSDARPGSPDFEAVLEPKLRALPLFRAPTDTEIDAAYAAYRTGDYAHLCDVWAEVASAQRVTLPGMLQTGYDNAGLAPTAVNAYAFLASLRAVQQAGPAFRAKVSDATRACLFRDFPWLENRHQHIPPGWTPDLEFPPEFGAWVDAPTLDEVRARWQLAAGLNEVQQAHQTSDCARRFRIPELRLHAKRERELAINYFGHAAPRVTRSFFRETLFLLDALNAGVFHMICVERAGEMVRRSVMAAFTKRGEWRAFVEGLGRKQWLLPVPARPS